MPFCPKCKYEYVQGTIKCLDCDIELVEGLPVEEEKPVKLVTIYTTLDTSEASVIKSLLEQAGINCFLSGPLSWPYVVATAETKIQVPEEQVNEAKTILDEYLRSDEGLASL